MDPIIFTPRLELTLVTKAERGSQELEWLHELRSNEQTTWWSITGRSSSIEDTERVVAGFLPTSQGEETTYRVVYAVHRIHDPMSASISGSPQPEAQANKSTEFIGLVSLKSLDATTLALPENLALPNGAAPTTLTLELAYQFLPVGWGKGFATESLEAVFSACKRARSFWTPFETVHIQAIVNEGNPASLRVMEKTGMTKCGIYLWTGKIWLAGGWRERDNLHIFGMRLLE